MNLEQILSRITEIRSQLESEKVLDTETLNSLDTELRGLIDQKTAIETRQRLLDEASKINEGAAGETRTIQTFNTNQEQRKDLGTDSIEYRKAFMNHVLRGDAIPTELRADAITNTSDVGAVIPNTILNRIVEKLEAVGMILSLVTRTSIKGGVAIPTSTLKPVATWVTQGAGSDKQKKTTGSIAFAYHKLRCAVAVTLEVETVTLEIFEQTLINNIVEAMTKAIEQAIINGDGSGKPKGILAETPVTDQVVSAAAVTYESLCEAEGSLPLAYEGGAVWVMTKKTFMAYMGLTDDAGQPIARVNYGLGGKPERTLLGRQVVLCDYLDSYTTSLAANKVFAFLFNFKDYVLNTNYQMGIKKYEDNDTDDMVTKAVMLVDGKVIDKNSLVVIKKVTAS